MGVAIPLPGNIFFLTRPTVKIPGNWLVLGSLGAVSVQNEMANLQIAPVDSLDSFQADKKKKQVGKLILINAQTECNYCSDLRASKATVVAEKLPHCNSLGVMCT